MDIAEKTSDIVRATNKADILAANNKNCITNLENIIKSLKLSN